MSLETAVILGSLAGVVIAVMLSSLIDRRIRRTERRLIDQLLTMTAEAHADVAEACRGLVDLYGDAQPAMPHRFGELELRKKMLTDVATNSQTRADLLQEVARRPLSHARAKALLAQVDTASDRLNGWGIE